MTEQLEMGDAFSETEALIRDAGRYLEVSDDLRPRVLESARATRRERKARRFIGLAALVVFSLAITGWPGTTLRSVGDAAGDRHEGQPMMGITSSEDLFAVVAARSGAATCDPSWAFVEAFSQLRQQQSDLLHAAF